MRINVNVEGIDALTSRLNKLCNIENALLKGGEVVRAEAHRRIVRRIRAGLPTALLYRARVATAFLSVRQPNAEYMLSSEHFRRFHIMI